MSSSGAVMVDAGFFLFGGLIPVWGSRLPCSAPYLYNIGLLAGLHEFPTAPNVSSSEAKSPSSHLSPLLGHLLVDAPRTDGGLRTAAVRNVGDVKHVFSHIIKTYRVVWAVLEGGGDGPPALKVVEAVPVTAKGKGKKVKVVAKGREASASAPAGSMWVRLEDVEHAKYVLFLHVYWASCLWSSSVGIGVMKVWKLVRTLWE
jgi:A/G-specific adenine glycosylase